MAVCWTGSKTSSINRGRSELLQRLPDEAVAAEIGVWEGDFSEVLLATTKELHLIDPWVHQPDFPRAKCAKRTQREMDAMFSRVIERFSDQVTIHRGYSQDVLPRFPDNYFDFIYIDGNHDYDYVKSDIELSLQKARIVCGDDYGFSSVKKAVQEYDHERIGDQWIIQ